MKKFVSILTLTAILLSMCIFTGCEEQIVGSIGRGNFGDNSSVPEADLSNLPEIEGIDFAYEIEYFNSTMLNTFTLKVGDSHTPSAAIWADASSDGHCYSSDESVVFVARNGNVFAKGKGTAYVVIKGTFDRMYEVYKYIVK